eukprot:6490535-Amphidinium_carterae.2
MVVLCLLHGVQNHVVVEAPVEKTRPERTLESKRPTAWQMGPCNGQLVLLNIDCNQHRDAQTQLALKYSMP